jgi:hypothetical protein
MQLLLHWLRFWLRLLVIQGVPGLDVLKLNDTITVIPLVVACRLPADGLRPP